MEIPHSKQQLDRHKTFICSYAKKLNIDYNPINHTVKNKDDINTIIALCDRAMELEFGLVMIKKYEDEIKADKLNSMKR